MFHILGFIFIFILAILVIGLVIIATVVGKIFNIGFRTPSYHRPQNDADQSNKDWESTTEDNKDIHPKRKKIFSEDEGEYIDFEEVK